MSPPTPPQIKFRQSSSAATTTTTSSSQDARLLVRETLRISANLASSATSSSSSSPPDACTFHGVRILCSEEIDGRRWNYVAHPQTSSIRAISLQTPQPPAHVLYTHYYFDCFLMIFV